MLLPPDDDFNFDKEIIEFTSKKRKLKLGADAVRKQRERWTQPNLIKADKAKSELYPYLADIVGILEGNVSHFKDTDS